MVRVSFTRVVQHTLSVIMLALHEKNTHSIIIYISAKALQPRGDRWRGGPNRLCPLWLIHTVAASSKVRAERAGGCRDRLGTAHLYGYKYSRITR